jgi:hypothetical protein
VHDRRAAALLDGWIGAAPPRAPARRGDRGALRPLQQAFVRACASRPASGARRGTAREAARVSAAIDRVADGFLALDANSARSSTRIPAAGALLGVARDALLGVDAMAFVPRSATTPGGSSSKR